VEVGEETGHALWSPTGTQIAYQDSDGIHIADATTGDELSQRATTEDLVDWSW
jgi:hypothetical protein